MLSATMPVKRISKSTLSMFLRTRCDKELYLSLHDKKKMEAAGLPGPVKRPGIGILSMDGQQFEIERNDQLKRLFPGNIEYDRGATSYTDVDLENALLKVISVPRIVLQGRFSIARYKTETLKNIGLSPSDIAVVPDIADFIPDVLVLRESCNGDLEVKENGDRKPVQDSTTEKRWAIDIFDVKHTSEANPSYCAEIAMYALMLANWLYHHPILKDRFYVTTNAYLWTRFKQGDSKLDQLENTGGSTVTELLQGLVSDSEDANLRFYLASVHRFLEDVVRVIKIGDAAPGAWTGLEWHVNSACGSCDWLGDVRHLGGKEVLKVSANSHHYCMPAAKMNDHLCLVPGITRGAKKILQLNGLSSTTALASASGHAAFQQHTVLKKDAKNLPTRSAAILSGALSNDPNVAIASLVGSANLLLYASVNFDSSSGLLTGLVLSGTGTTFASGQSPRRFTAMPYVVDQKTIKAEWVALEAFLSQIASCITAVEGMGVSNPTGQIHFWEERQFKELCNAMGRHLPRVLALAEKKAKALAWVFPPDELIAKPDSLEASTIVTVEDIVKRMVFTPTPHVLTLFDTVEHYADSSFVPTVRDSYYREYLSNGIPRERIYEIWSNTTQIKRGSSILPRNTVIAEYSNALTMQSKALESICARLRKDYKGHFKAKTTRISVTIPKGANSVAFDAKLWFWWDNLEFNVSQMESHIRLALDGDRLEATYEAIILRNGKLISPGRYEFDVSPGSTEAKFKEDSMLTLGKLGRPGMPLEHVSRLLKTSASTFSGDPRCLQMPLWSALKVRLVTFDRVKAKAHVEYLSEMEPQLVPYLIANSDVDLLTDVFLLETKKPNAFNWGESSGDILREIGNPAIAVPDQSAADAMGIQPSSSRRRTGSPITPAARVLWDADALEQKSVVLSATAKAIASYVETQDNLNPSQSLAVEHSAERSLTIIWGPPGTGKTNTLAALLHGLTQEANTRNSPLRILVTGPTYKAVEELMYRTANLLSKDPAAIGTMYMGYSRSRALGSSLTSLPAHVSYTPISIDNQDPTYQQFLLELFNGSDVVIVGCQIRQARRFPKELGSFVQPLFDVVIIDESSQVPVSQSLSALCGLKEDARLIIAGDHLQMPPITSIEPPCEAAYLVGSIQTYLLQRRFNYPVTQCTLEMNYRSNEHIVEFARRIGYSSSLQSHYPMTALHFINQLSNQSVYPVTLPWCEAFTELLTPAHKIVTLLHEDEVSSQGNHFEARVVAGTVWMLRQSVSANLDGHGPVTTHAVPTPNEFWDNCVGIVTPHRAQRALVIRELQALFPGEQDLISEAVDTVERFQGGERHTIIVTFGVGDTDVISGEEAFLMQLERTNVAVSRAMAKCIVVMPRTLAAYIPEDKKALATAFALKEYIEDFCNIRIDTKLFDSKQTRLAQVRYHQ
jgi:AAA domain